MLNCCAFEVFYLMAFFFKILGCDGGVIQGAVGYLLFFGGLITAKTIHRAVGDAATGLIARLS